MRISARLTDQPPLHLISQVDSEEDQPPNSDAAQGATYVYTHKSFSLAYNGDRIIYVNLTSENPVLVTDGRLVASVVRWWC